MKVLTLFFVSLSVVVSARAEAFVVRDVFDCMTFIKTNVRNYERNARLTDGAIEYICKTSSSSPAALVDAANCTYDSFLTYYSIGGHRGTANGEGTFLACSYSDGKRDACVLHGQDLGYNPESISRICNPNKERARADEAVLKK